MLAVAEKILYWQNFCVPRFTPKNIYFEFGVYDNNTLIAYINAVKEFCAKYNKDINQFKIYGFDSFEGLPSPKDGDNHLDWDKGVFRCNKEELEKNIMETGFPMQNVHLIKGYFEDTLTKDLLEELKYHKIFPSFVNIDVDYYSSTKTVIEWLLPLLHSGCFLYFDDIWSFYGHPDYGELRYIKEFNKSDKGYLTPFNYMSIAPDQLYIFCRKEWEWGRLM